MSKNPKPKKKMSPEQKELWSLDSDVPPAMSRSQEPPDKQTMLTKIIKALLNFLGFKLGHGGAPPTPSQVENRLKQPDAAKEAEKFFSSNLIKNALKSKMAPWIAKQLQKFLDSNPKMKEAIQNALKENRALCDVIQKNVKGTPMEKISKGLLPPAPRPATLAVGSVSPKPTLSAAPNPRPTPKAPTKKNDEGDEDKTKQEKSVSRPMSSTPAKQKAVARSPSSTPDKTTKNTPPTIGKMANSKLPKTGKAAALAAQNTPGAIPQMTTPTPSPPQGKKMVAAAASEAEKKARLAKIATRGETNAIQKKEKKEETGFTPSP